MNRFLKRTAYTPHRMRTIRPPRNEFAQQRSFKLDRFVNRTTIELVLLAAILGFTGSILVQHPYFKLTDIKIEGLDTYAADLAKAEISAELASSFFGLQHDTYVLFNEDRLAAALHRTLALESLQIEKRFPHTVVVRANEVSMIARVSHLNGDAYIGTDGTLVRWYNSTSTPVTSAAYTNVVQDMHATQTHIGAPIMDPARMLAVKAVQDAAVRISTEPLAAIALFKDHPERAELLFAHGMRVILKLDGDIAIQLKKAEVSGDKYPNAKSIDVRFADKVFVSF